jgi:hypothetical protein
VLIFKYGMSISRLGHAGAPGCVTRTGDHSCRDTELIMTEFAVHAAAALFSVRLHQEIKYPYA